MKTIDRGRLRSLMEREVERYVAARPKCRALSERAKRSLVGGVPMQWMVEWPGPFPLFAAEARGAEITDVDGHTYVDMCLGDTGSMFGHSPAVVADAVAEQMRRGVTLMVPSSTGVPRRRGALSGVG